MDRIKITVEPWVCDNRIPELRFVVNKNGIEHSFAKVMAPPLEDWIHICFEIAEKELKRALGGK